MGDRSRAHQRLGAPEKLLHLHEVAVAQDGLQGRDPGVGAQHEQAIIACLLGQLAGIDLERPRVRGDAQVAPVGGVADQSLVAPLQLLVKGVKGLSSASTTVRTRLSVRSRAPSTYSSPRSSRAAMVGAEIMPRSATTQTRPMAKRLRRRSMTGTSTLTSAVLPGHISEQTGRPAASITTPTIICMRSGRWSFE